MNDTAVRPHLLVIAGVGGPSPKLLAPSLAPVARVTWLYDPRDLTKPARDIPIMEAAGRTVSAAPDEAVATAVDLHSQDPVDGVLTFSENALRTAAAVSTKLGLPGNSVLTAERLTNKYLQRQALIAAGVPCPRFHPARTEEELATAVAHVGLPAVLKPVRGGGSALTGRVDSPEELRAAWARAAAVLQGLDADDRTHRLLSDTERPHMMLEELLVGLPRRDDPGYGDYVSVESLVRDGVVRHLTVTDKLPLASGFRENGQMHPSVLPAEEQTEVTDMATAALTALGVREGITHTELKLTADGPRVIEVNGRAAGGLWVTLQHAAAYDVIAAAARAVGRAGEPELPRFTRHAAMLTPCLDAGLAGRPVHVALDPSFEERDGVHSVHGLHSGVFDLALGGGHALLAYVSGERPERVHDHWRALQGALRVEEG